MGLHRYAGMLRLCLVSIPISSTVKFVREGEHTFYIPLLSFTCEELGTLDMNRRQGSADCSREQGSRKCVSSSDAHNW